jgi:N-acetylneuraminic acid mutarotase
MKTKIIYQIAIVIIMAATLRSADAQGSWIQKTNFGGAVGAARWGAVGFSIGTKGYIGCGNNGANKKDFWEWDQTSNAWTQLADFGGTARYQAVGFSIGSKGYIGTGAAGSAFPYSPLYKDFWEYDPSSNIWTVKAPFGGTVRFGAVGFSAGGKGYIGTGFNDVTYFKKDLWEYDPASDSWTQKLDFPGTARMEAVGFSIAGKGYLGTGGDYNTGTLFNDFWEYNPTSNSWVLKAPFLGVVRSQAVGVGTSGKGYIGIGGNFNGSGGSLAYTDFWEYDPVSNAWAVKAPFTSAGARWLSTSFSIGSMVYIGTGGNFAPTYKDLWEYNPSAVGINELDKKETISIFPNPSSGPFVIKSTDAQIQSLVIYNVKGEKLYDKEVSAYSTNIDLTDKPTGVYLIQITAGNNSFTKKIILK